MRDLSQVQKGNSYKFSVYLWHGKEDVSVPPSMGQYMAEYIPNCEATSIEDAGHFWIFEHLPEMLEKLVGDYDGQEFMRQKGLGL